MHIRAFARVSTVNVALAALTAASASALHAQSRTQNRPSHTSSVADHASDSLIAAVLADTLDLSAGSRVPTRRARQSVTIRPTMRSYSVGNIDAAEQGVYTSFVTRYPRATIRLDVTPLTFRGDTSGVANRPQVSFGGMSPVSGRLDLRVRSADTLRVFAQSGSSPGALSAQDAQALGAVGTSTIDLDAASLGLAARVGTRYVLTQPLGASGVSLSLRGGVEYDPKPSGTDVVSWRGTTVRGGVGVARAGLNTTLGTSVEVTQSYTDSLGGRNQFPGGGSLNVEARMLRLIGREGTSLVSLNAFYSRPLNIQRPNVRTRLIPIGDFMGATASGAMPVGPLSLLPTVTVLRESSLTQTSASGTTTRRDASGTTAVTALGLSIPLGRHLTVTPEGGVAFGSVGQTSTSTSVIRNQRQTFRDSIRGRYLTLEISLRD